MINIKLNSMQEYLMTVLENLFQQYQYIAKHILNRQFENELVKKIIEFIDKEYHNLVFSDATKRVIPKEINQKMHIVTPCFTIAVYRALKKKVLPKITIEDFSKLMMDIFRDLVGSLAEMQKNQIKNATNKWKSFKEATIFGTENTYGSFEPKFIKNDEGVLKFHLNKCIYFEIFKVHNELAISPVLCKYDEIFAETVDEWISFSRPKIIAEGDNYCEFFYQLKDVPDDKKEN